MWLPTEEGLYLRCRIANVRDGDTVVVKVLGGAYEWAIRLIDCWAPELCTDEGQAAKRYAEYVLELEAENLWVFIPAPVRLDNLLKNLTFDRIPGHLFIAGDTTLGDETLSQMMVRAGHATKTKDG